GWSVPWPSSETPRRSSRPSRCSGARSPGKPTWPGGSNCPFSGAAATDSTSSRPASPFLHPQPFPRGALMLPDLKAYHFLVLNSSAGKDSQAMLDYVVELADRAGVPRSRLLVAHADLGRVEWPGTRELAEEQARHYGLAFVAVARPQGDLLDHIPQRGMFPSPSARYCTANHKRGQIM